MENKHFGLYVKTLREQRASYWHSWTQEYLAEKADIEPDQVARIEQGRVKKLLPYLEGLAMAFGLNELQKVEFWALAGYNYRPSQLDISKQRIYDLLEQLYFPASARTPVWDFIAFNCYHEVLWGYTPENIALLNEHPGPNLLRVLFDNEFRKSQTRHLTDNDLRFAVAIFRTISFRYITTERYDEVVQYMSEHYPLFEHTWRDVDRNPPDIEMLQTPINKVRHDVFQEIEFMSLHIPPRYVGEEVDISIYVPLSIDKYRELREFTEDYVKDTGQRVRKFRDQPLLSRNQ